MPKQGQHGGVLLACSEQWREVEIAPDIRVPDQHGARAEEGAGGGEPAGAAQEIGFPGEHHVAAGIARGGSHHLRVTVEVDDRALAPGPAKVGEGAREQRSAEHLERGLGDDRTERLHPFPAAGGQEHSVHGSMISAPCS